MLDPLRPKLELGSFAKPFCEQLADQGCSFDSALIDHLWQDAQATSRLVVRRVISRTAGSAAYTKIGKAVWAEVARANPTTPTANSPSGEAVSAGSLATDESNTRDNGAIVEGEGGQKEGNRSS